MKKKIIIFSLLLIVLLVSACTQIPSNGKTITIYKSPTCGCCVEWASYMEQNGFTVKTIMLTDMSTIKEKYKIPSEMESCHTAEIDGYFIEGHVPVEITNKLLEEKPSIDGIALPRMPSGTPGMPGPKRELWTIYALTNGNVTEYITI